jgi:fibronectin type 3 domain-containing protein
VSGTTPSLPSAPTNLLATAGSVTKITLTWSAAVSGGLPIQYYQVLRGSSPANLSALGNTGVTSYTDRSLTADTLYYYAVTAVDTGGDVSPLSAIVPISTPSLPSAPANVAAEAISKTEIDVTWTAALSGMPLQSYSVYRGSSPANLTLLKVVGLTKLLYADRSLTSGTTYYYGIEATDTQGNISSMSSVVQATTP